MLEQLDSHYNCANAGDDLHGLKQQLEQLVAMSKNNKSIEMKSTISRLENQIHFIQNKCDIKPKLH